MATTKKSVKKVIVKKNDCPCGCGCCAGDSVKYTNIWDAWHAFWRRGFSEWAGTSSRSEYWLAWIGNLCVLVISGLVLSGVALIEYSLFGHPAFVTWVLGTAILLYMIACIIPAISMMTRRMHDAGLSAWLWLVYIFSIAPSSYAEGAWVYAPSVGLIVSLLPTQVRGNMYHKNNK